MTSTNFRPLHDRVVVRRVESEEKTKGGIIIPDTAKVPAHVTRPARSSLSTSRLAIAFCSASGRAPKSSSTAKTF